MNRKGTGGYAMKGLELPISMIVVIAIAILVLVVIAAFFTGWFTGGTIDIERENALNRACNTFRIVYNCDTTQIGNVDVQYKEIGEATPQTHKLYPELCNKKGFTAPEQCAIRCGCPST
jgi:hypothetical protein